MARKTRRITRRMELLKEVHKRRRWEVRHRLIRKIERNLVLGLNRAVTGEDRQLVLDKCRRKIARIEEQLPFPTPYVFARLTELYERYSPKVAGDA